MTKVCGLVITVPAGGAGPLPVAAPGGGGGGIEEYVG